MQGVQHHSEAFVHNEVAKLYSAGRWLMLLKDFVRAMPDEEAIVLGYLISEADYHCAHKETEWFFCTYEKMEKELNKDDHKQTRIFNRLKEKQLIETTRRGNPAKRWIRIRFDKIHKLIESL